MWRVGSCKATELITAESDPFQAWLIVHASQAQQGHSAYDRSNDPAQLKIFNSMPLEVQQYLQIWYPYIPKITSSETLKSPEDDSSVD